MFRHFWIDHRLAASIKPYNLRNMQVISKALPMYRFADYYRAIEAFLGDKKKCDCVNTNHNLPLIDFVRGNFPQHVSRRLNPSSKKAFAVDYEKSETLPLSNYWTFIDEENSMAGIIRVVETYNGQLNIDMGLTDSDQLLPTLERLDELSIEHSVYKNKFLQVDIDAQIHDEYSNAANYLQIVFRRPPDVHEAQIIFDPNVRKLVDRNIVSFLKNRERFKELGLPMQRGVLFYGPPGTGKTYTCHFLYGQLKPVTMLTVSGKGLGEVRSICNLARMLQPSVLVLEDVDLIFTSREINLYSTALGDMMDELDAFKKNESVLFILTTNSIDRLEQAIKDRPGRIAQCIHFGPPTRELREKYLARFLENMDISKVSLPHVAEITDGASQAFLEELTYRALQIAAESNLENKSQTLQLTDEFFDEAVAEMTNKNNSATGSIIGFTPN